jgi:hypothetical protein
MLQTSDQLACALNDLKKAANADSAGGRQEWAAEAGQALRRVGRAWLSHLTDAEAPESLFDEVDWTRPSLVRQVEQLRQEHDSFVELIFGLRDDLRRLTQAPDVDRSQPDVGSVQLRLRQLFDRLEHHRNHETDLVQESITTDLGAAD